MIRTRIIMPLLALALAAPATHVSAQQPTPAETELAGEIIWESDGFSKTQAMAYDRENVYWTADGGPQSITCLAPQSGGYNINFIGYQNALRGNWRPCYETQRKLIAAHRGEPGFVRNAANQVRRNGAAAKDPFLAGDSRSHLVDLVTAMLAAPVTHWTTDLIRPSTNGGRTP